jgi:2-methylcitrate dehydratase PrpD
VSQKKTLSQELSEFAAGLERQQIPAEVLQRAKMLLLDAVGVAFAATKFDFAQRALAGLRLMGSGDADLIGIPDKLALRDAVLMNAILVHGLDYDDTYLPGSIHLSASCVPTALGVGASIGASGQDVLTACALGLEAGARLGAAGKGGFLRAGFHATSIVGTFACALVAGRLMKMPAGRLTMAQGIALSMTSGNMQPMQDGSWTKRMHPGLSGASGVLAATMAQQGYIGPTEAYEGRFGLFPCFLGQYARDADLNLAHDGLGQRWEFPRSSIKLFPACHQSHAFFNAAIGISRAHEVRPEHIESIRVRIAEPAVPLICEPLAAKRKPDSSYAAQFSLPYGIACCLTRGRFGLGELEQASYSNPALLALAHKVDYEIDPSSGFPKFRSGEVIVNTKDGRKLTQRESIRPDEPAADDAIAEKFMNSAGSVMSQARATRLRDAILDFERIENVRSLTRMLGTTS